MLAPHSRRILLEALRPPDGFRLEAAVATTYSLDLIALLMAPLAFSLLDRLVDQEHKGDPLDGLAVLRAVREHAERLTVFCDAGCIGLHRGAYRQLLTYLEDAVVPVQAPKGGAFHPKLWVLRFVAPREPDRIRVIVPSRNLTLDQSWDTMLVLEGELTDRTRAFADNNPLGELVEALPSFAWRSLSRARRKVIENLAQDVRRVRFELPPDFESARFWAFGLEGKNRDPFDTRIDRMLVVAPFVSATELQRLGQEGVANVLVSRPDELAKISGKALEGFAEVFTLHEGADAAGTEADEVEGNGFSPRKGLHAKLFVADSGRTATIWTGSANATHAAFHTNVEILVELSGKKSVCGVDAVLAGDQPNLRSVLVPYVAPPLTPPDPIQQRLETAVDDASRELATGKWVGIVSQPTALDQKEVFDVEIRLAKKVSLPGGVTAIAWPIALPDSRAMPVPSGTSPQLQFRACSFAALTTFFAFRVRAHESDRTVERTFVVPIPMDGFPADRQARVLESLLDEPWKLLRFLRLLLAIDPTEAAALIELDLDDGPGLRGHTGSPSAVPLLESLVRALQREPERIDAVERLVADLRKTERGKKLLPPDFDLIWEPLRLAHEQLGRSRS